MVITGKADNLNLHLKWYTNAINPHLVVPLALPGMTKGIDSMICPPREVLNTENIETSPEHQVGTEGGPRGTKMGHEEAPQRGENLMGAIRCTVWDWRRTIRITMSTMQCFPAKIYTQLALILATQTDSPIFG